MQTHPALIERSVGSTLCSFSRGKLTFEEAALDLFEVVSSQISGRTHYSMAIIGYYVRAILAGMRNREIALADAFDAFVDAAAAGTEGHCSVTSRLAQPLSSARG
jgi:hypothetical protein